MHTFADLILKHQLDAAYAQFITTIIQPLADYLNQCCKTINHPLLVGINGAQGSGKSTLSVFLQAALQQKFALECCVLSLDDFYLDKATRVQRAKTHHPLFRTRGVPGTHDIHWLQKTLDALQCNTWQQSVSWPKFNKAADDRAPKSQWHKQQNKPDIIIFEGWCVGLNAQLEQALIHPINQLEQEADAGGHWRKQVNTFLDQDYQVIFARIDQLIFLHIPDFSLVYEWRSLQEQKLAEQGKYTSESCQHIMNASQIYMFIQHFQRLSEHALRTLPQRADICIKLDKQHKMTDIYIKPTTRQI